jgi:hypothetical protein
VHFDYSMNVRGGRRKRGGIGRIFDVSVIFLISCCFVSERTVKRKRMVVASQTMRVCARSATRMRLAWCSCRAVTWSRVSSVRCRSRLVPFAVKPSRQPSACSFHKLWLVHILYDLLLVTYKATTYNKVFFYSRIKCDTAIW